MAERAYRVTNEFDLILPADREKPKEKQSRFFFQPLTGAQRARVWDEQNWTERAPDGTQRLLTRAYQEARRIVLEQLLRAENFPASAPEDYPGRDASLAKREAWLELLDDGDVLVLANLLIGHCVLGPDAKNSSAPSPTSG